MRCETASGSRQWRDRATARDMLRVLLALAVAGCSPSSTDVPPLPQIPSQGGRVIAHVKLVTITFQGDPNEQQIQAFGDWFVQSSWLSEVGAEYGIGAG